MSFPYPLSFVLANQPQVMGKVLAIVHRAIATYLINKAGFKVSQAPTGVVTLIQRFGSALNLNLHFHVLFIDGVFLPKEQWSADISSVQRPHVQAVQE
ncbi:transposase [Granulosicoccus antarcticus]|uniref:transposase n=1 Tax=Granulosicoccus antarcticus TaxID=437505 RepID=UPI00146FB2E7